MSEKQKSSSSIKRYDPETGDAVRDFAVIADSKFKFNVADTDRVQRRLKQRHVQMYVFSYPPNVLVNTYFLLGLP